jgi:threonine dehydratase
MPTNFTPPAPPDVVHAAARIAGHVVRTPMLRNTALDRATGGTILVKPEILQRTGSFKLRGATNALLRLTQEQRAAGIVTYSSGNHGQGIACAAAALGVAATIVMPADAPAIKRDATAAWGANIVTYDRLRDDREAIGQKIQAETGATLIPPYDHPDVIAGQGTLALELAADAKEAGLILDSLLVPAGGGGLVAGCALALAAVSPATKIYAVEPQGWDDTGRSLVSGQRETNDMQGSKLCDALLAPAPGVLTFPINQKYLAGGLVVTDDEVRAAQAYAARHLKLVVEPGGAVALAALLAGRIDAAGLTVGIVLSGGNADI